MAPMNTITMMGLLVILCLVSNPAQAQMTRESGVSSIAGTLQKTIDDSDDYLVVSRGSQVLFVDLDAAMFINKETHSDHDSGMEPATADDATHEEGGCGGPGGFAIEVLNDVQEVICSAEKPKSPGWEGDPRLVCLLDERGEYILRVGFATAGGHKEPASTPAIHPYLLNVSLRGLAEDVPYLGLAEAIKQSRNRLPLKD